MKVPLWYHMVCLPFRNLWVHIKSLLNQVSSTSHLGPAPARDAQALAWPVSDSLSELPRRVRLEAAVFSAIKIVQFCM